MKLAPVKKARNFSFGKIKNSLVEENQQIKFGKEVIA